MQSGRTGKRRGPRRPSERGKRERVGALQHGPAATEEQERKRFAASGALQIADVSQSDFHNSINSMKLENRIQIRFECGLGIIAEVIALRPRNLSRVSIA